MKRSLNITLTLGFSLFLLTGCFEEEMTCQNEVAHSLVKELAQQQVANDIVMAKYDSGAYGEPNMFIRNMIIGAEGNFEGINMLFNGFGDSKAKKDGKENLFTLLQKEQTRIQSELNETHFSLSSILTKEKNKELSKVECAATLGVSFENQNYNYSTAYTAQLTDDKKEVMVELLTLEAK